MEPVTGAHVTDDIKCVKVSVKYKTGIGAVSHYTLNFRVWNLIFKTRLLFA